VTLALGLAAAGLTLPLTSASAVSPDVVISEVYGGGGNSGATLRNDFIELRNLGTSAVDLTGWSVQYASAAGTTWQVTPLSGSIEPGGLYLVKEAAGAGGTTDLPPADASGSISMSATAAKVISPFATTHLTYDHPNRDHLRTVCGKRITADWAWNGATITCRACRRAGVTPTE